MELMKFILLTEIIVFIKFLVLHSVIEKTRTGIYLTHFLVTIFYSQPFIFLLQLSFYLLFLLHLNLINIPIRHQLYIIYLCYTPVDGEMVIDTVQGQKFPRYLVYDIIRFIFFYSFLYIAISRNLQNSRIT